MKAPTSLTLLTILGLSTCFLACENSLEDQVSHLSLPEAPFNYDIGVKNEVPTLGRVLFYDTRLSANNTTSCASCHKQEFAFSDNAKFSRGFRGELTDRNSMPIQNIISAQFPVSVNLTNGQAFKSTSLFWDGRQQEVLKMVMEPIQNHIEMGVNSLDELERKIKGIKDYEELFVDAYSTKEITKSRIANALSAFIVSIRSTGSRFDASLFNGNSSVLNSQEQQGKNLFFSTYNCNSCHQLQEPFNGYQAAAAVIGLGESGGFADIGLDQNPTDGGVFRQSGTSTDNGKFKIPSLRNIELTGPYMHDGRFKTLEDVIDHYSTGIENSANLDQRLQTDAGVAKKFNIPASDKYAIIAFLRSMTDHHLVNDPRFSNPFEVH